MLLTRLPTNSSDCFARVVVVVLTDLVAVGSRGSRVADFLILRQILGPISRTCPFLPLESLFKEKL